MNMCCRLSTLLIGYCLYVLLVGTQSEQMKSLVKDPDVGLNVFQIIAGNGHAYEEHVVETEDGYLLGLHRVLPKRRHIGATANSATKSPPVLLVPGVMCSSVDWVNIGTNKSLGFIMSDLGYDVWLLNPRGVTWSRKHTKLDPDEDKEQYWGFSWHEIGYYDLPATIDYVLAKTGVSQLFYVGHSQGATAFFVMASTRPDYNRKVRLMSAFAPAVYLSNMPNAFLREISKLHQFGDWLVRFTGLYEFVHHPMSKTMQKECEESAWVPQACHPLMFLTTGFDVTHIDPGKTAVIIANMPAGGAVKQMLHYGQVVQSGLFRPYDYGTSENMRVYNFPVPPEYNLSAITAPVAIYYGENDWYLSKQDIHQLIQELPNVVTHQMVPSRWFNHVDFMWSKDAVEVLYKYVIEEMGPH